MVKLQVEIDVLGTKHIVKCENEIVSGVKSVDLWAGPQELSEVTIVLYARDCDISWAKGSN